jgi:hypothetical protein
MDDLPLATLYEAFALRVPSDAERHPGYANRPAHGWAAYDRADWNSPGSVLNTFGNCEDIADALVAVEDNADFDWGRTGSEIPGATLIGQQTSRDGVRHNVYKMPFGKVENQARYRD